MHPARVSVSVSVSASDLSCLSACLSDCLSVSLTQSITLLLHPLSPPPPPTRLTCAAPLTAFAKKSVTAETTLRMTCAHHESQVEVLTAATNFSTCLASTAGELSPEAAARNCTAFNESGACSERRPPALLKGVLILVPHVGARAKSNLFDAMFDMGKKSTHAVHARHT